MARYIDADKIITDAINERKFIFAMEDAKRNEIIYRTVYKDLYEFIESQPTADVAEVVRCGECKKWKINPNNLYGGYCRHCEGASIDHFCSYGERKNNNAE